MGSVMGKVYDQESGLTPSYDVLQKSTEYEVRAYPSYFVAEVQGEEEVGSEDSRFMTLAKVWMGEELRKL